MISYLQERAFISESNTQSFFRCNLPQGRFHIAYCYEYSIVIMKSISIDKRSTTTTTIINEGMHISLCIRSMIMVISSSSSSSSSSTYSEFPLIPLEMIWTFVFELFHLRIFATHQSCT